MSKMATAIGAAMAAMMVATVVPVQASFYTRDDDRKYALEMRFMFSCIQRGGAIDSCKAKLQHERDKGTLY